MTSAIENIPLVSTKTHTKEFKPNVSLSYSMDDNGAPRLEASL
jgi:hypothetical protein